MQRERRALNGTLALGHETRSAIHRIRRANVWAVAKRRHVHADENHKRCAYSWTAWGDRSSLRLGDVGFLHMESSMKTRDEWRQHMRELVNSASDPLIFAVQWARDARCMRRGPNHRRVGAAPVRPCRLWGKST